MCRRAELGVFNMLGKTMPGGFELALIAVATELYAERGSGRIGRCGYGRRYCDRRVVDATGSVTRAGRRPTAMAT
jgi:hypothetical protein